jgi:formylglycine-generating enzyme required for sulfatase activity
MKRISLLAVAGLFTCLAHAAPNVYRNPIEMAFVEIPAGTFMMDADNLDEAVAENPDDSLAAVQDESPAHRVELTESFFLGTTEVTQKQWLDVMGTKPGPEEYWTTAEWENLPVVSVSWDDVERFIGKLHERDPGSRYRLPTEAEWEYAARAGAQGLRPMTVERLPEHAWYIANSGDVPHPVATRKPNPWGLYDMLGNVWEWTQDRYAPDAYARAPVKNPAGPNDGGKRVRRGGSYHCPLHMVRTGYRAADTPDTAYAVIGFRLIAQPRVVPFIRDQASVAAFGVPR